MTKNFSIKEKEVSGRKAESDEIEELLHIQFDFGWQTHLQNLRRVLYRGSHCLLFLQQMASLYFQMQEVLLYIQYQAYHW